MSRSLLRTRFASALGVLALTTPAGATIVWQGKEVAAWPDEAPPALPTGAQLAATNTGLYPHPKGNVYGLTLLIDFNDAQPAFDKAQVDAWLNQKGYAQGGLNGSVRDYYLEESNGMVDFQNEIFGFYRAKQPKSHYESTNGYEGSDELFGEIMDYFDALVDFAKYDNDKDGRTDAISIVYAGDAETWGKGLWPHASGSNQKRDGVTIARYMMTNLGDDLGLYTFSHEVGHMLFGWPDLYGFGNYCIMGNSSSSKNPVGINDFYRADQGWIPIVDVTKDTSAAYTAERNGAGYRYTNPQNSKESFFWSNVQSTGRFSTLQGDGVLLLHFDKNIGSNNPPNPLSLAVVQADGKKDLDQTMWPMPGSDAKDFFQGGGVSEFSGAKFATAKWNDGSASELHIYEVAAISEKMAFKVGNGPIVTPSGGSGGDMSSGGASGSGAVGGGGQGGAGGVSASGAAGEAVSGGAPATAGMSGSLGGAAPQAGSSNRAGAANEPAPPATDDAACGCRVASTPQHHGLGYIAAAWGYLGLRRRRRARGAASLATRERSPGCR